jgi:hypothetical protein
MKLIADNIDCILIDSSLYTYNYDHEFLSSVPTTTGTRSGTPQRLTNKIFQASDSPAGGTAGPSTAVPDYGVLDASDITFPSVANATGSTTCEAVLSYKETGGADTTKYLLFYYDTATSGLPVTPNNGDITVQWAEGAYRILQI